MILANKSMFSYRSLFKQAWLISWRHKYLWFFGLFSAIIAGGSSWEYQIFAQNLNRGLIEGSYFRLGNILAINDLIRDLGAGLVDLFNYDFWTILNVLSLIILTAVILLFFLWLAISSQAALVHDVKKILSPKKKAADLSVQAGIGVGHKHFWPLLGLNVLIKVLVALTFFIIGLPLLFMVWRDTYTLSIVYTILFIIFVPIAVGLSLLIKYAIAYRVLNNKSALSALEAGEKLFRKNWLISLEAAVLLFIINFLASIVLIIILSLIFLPLFVLTLIFGAAGLTVLVLVLAIILIVAFGSILTTFQTAAWTNLFISLTEKGGQAKLERLFGQYKI